MSASDARLRYNQGVYMPLASGDRLGPFEIVAPLGAGGMGDVYRAVDTRLARTVAIKILKGPFTDRFEREAKAISALNHANICTLYDLGIEDGTSYLVMEYLEGKLCRGRYLGPRRGLTRSNFSKRWKRRIAPASCTAM